MSVRGLRETAIALARRYKPDVLLVKEASVELKKILPRPVKPISVDRDKVGRLYVHKAKFEAGLVLLPEGAPFLPELETELLSFLQAKHDDQVDSHPGALA
jgi:predicted phage terminase large subunit-like protein